KLKIARDLLARYDKDKDGRLSREEIAFPRKLFDQLDRNRDGKLDVLELVRWTRAKPAGEFTVRLRNSRPVLTRRAGMMAREDRQSDMNVALEGVRINVVPRPAGISFGREDYLLGLF